MLRADSGVVISCRRNSFKNKRLTILMSQASKTKDGPDLEILLQNNRNWAEQVRQEDPEFFPRLATQQKPKYLWIGCSDSRVPANQITGLVPGEVFVHRNVANVIGSDDPNCQSVIEYAVNALEVEHIIVCGHYKCGGVQAAMQGTATGIVADWIASISDIWNAQQPNLAALPAAERLAALCELNVQHQLKSLAQSPAVNEAWSQGRALSLHGWIYSIEDGLLKDLGLSLHDQAGVSALG
jgi:carbonic anhydrase